MALQAQAALQGLRRGMAGRICLFVDTLGFKPYARELFTAYVSALRGTCDVIALIHKPPHMWLATPDVDHVMLGDHDIFSGFRHFKADTGNWMAGNNDLKLIAGVKARPEYDLYLKIEEDVLCTGDLVRAFNLLIETARGTALTASYILPYARNPDWMWWNTLQAPAHVDFDMETQAMRSFFPLMAASKDFLQAYESFLTQGWCGHYEVLMPTFAKLHGFSTADLAETSPPLTHFPQFSALEVTELETITPLFVHPVKTRMARTGILEQLARIRQGM